MTLSIVMKYVQASTEQLTNVYKHQKSDSEVKLTGKYNCTCVSNNSAIVTVEPDGAVDILRCGK